MKKLIAFLTGFILLTALMPLSLSAAVPIDADNFPDPVFREYVWQFDIDKDGMLSEKECSAVESISIPLTHKAVSSLTGIKNFTRLRYLDCIDSNLGELDLSGMSNIQYVYVYQSNLKTINLSGCPMLNLLNCRFNCLTSINLTGCSGLTCIMSNHNQVTELDVSDCVSLHELTIHENHIASIDVSKNKNLAFLTFEPQEVTAQKVQITGKWTVDLGMLVGKENLNKISSVNAGKLDTATGVLTIDTNPSDFSYTYKASDKFGINVHVTLYRGGLPVITANNLSIDPRDDAFDPLKESGLNLKAIDTEDGELTASVKAQVKTIAVLGSAAHNATVSYYTIPAVDTKTTGLYIIAYTVTDSSGNTANLNVYVTVRIYRSYSSARSEFGSSSNTANGSSINSVSEAYYSLISTSVTSVESGVTLPPMGATDSATTILLAIILITAAVIVLLVKRRQKAD